MKNTLLLYIFIALCLPTQASASVCLNIPLSYSKENVGKKVLKPKKEKKHKQKTRMLKAVLFTLFVFGALAGLIGWLVVGLIKGVFSGIVWWLLGGSVASILIFFFLAAIKAI